MTILTYLLIKRGLFMEGNNKFIYIIIGLIFLIVAGVATAGFLFSDNVTVNAEMNGLNASIELIAFPFGGNSGEMKSEMEIYLFRQMNNVSSNAGSIKEGLENIAKEHGYKDITVNIRSQFGENAIPMKVRVEGISMFPTLKNGELVIIEKDTNAKVVDIIVARDPEYGLLIKRLGAVRGNQIFLASDNKGIINTVVNGTPVTMMAVEKWTDASNIIGIAREFNV